VPAIQAKQYLRKIKRLDSFVKAKEEEISEIRNRLESLGCTDYLVDRIQTFSNVDKIPDGIGKLMDLEKKYEKAIRDLYALKKEASDWIENMDNEDYKLLLTLRYLRFKTFEEIAVEMHFSFQWICELHKRALIQFEKKYFKK